MAIRSFFAIPLSVRSELELADCAARLRQWFSTSALAETSMRWVPPQNFHLTLAFLGDIESGDVGRLHDVAREVAGTTGVAQFVLERFDWFPSALKPRLLVATPAPCETLMQLQQALSRRLHQSGFHPEKRQFRPHITLARIKYAAAPACLDAMAMSISCELDELVLFSSTQVRTRRGGSESVYSPLLVEPLGVRG